MKPKHALWLCVISYAFMAFVPFYARSPYGDLGRHFTDHLHHAFATQVFFEKGFDVYTQPFAEAWRGVVFPQRHEVWGNMPMAYPPGVFVVFAPLTAIAWLVPMDQATYGLVGILYMLIFAHVAWYGVLTTLEHGHGLARVVVAAASWFVLMEMGVTGFFDVVYIGLGVFALRSLARHKPNEALLFVALASFVHFRAACLAGVGLLALFRTLRKKRPPQYPWELLAVVTLLVAVSFAAFALMYPTTASFRHGRQYVLSGDARTDVAVASFALAAMLAVQGGAETALVLVACLVPTLTEMIRPWWHASFLMLAPLAATLRSQTKWPTLAVAAMFAWAVWVSGLVWEKRIYDVRLVRTWVENIERDPAPPVHSGGRAR